MQKYNRYFNVFLIALGIFTLLFTLISMYLSIQFSTMGEKLELTDKRIHKVNEEVICSSELIALFRSSSYIKYVAENKLGMTENPSKILNFKIEIPNKYKNYNPNTNKIEKAEK